MSFLRTISTYSIGSLLSAGIPFLVLPILTFHLSPADYGVLRLLSAYVLLIVPFVSLMSNGLSTIEYFKKPPSDFASLFTSTIRIPFVLTTIYSVLIYVLRDSISELTDIPPAWLICIPILALGTILTDVTLSMMVQQKKASAHLGFSLSRTILETGSTLILVVWMGMNWQGRVSSWALSVLIFSVIGLVYFKRQGWLSGVTSKDWTRQAMLFGLPLIPHALSKFVINQSDIIFISKMVSVEASGLYGVGYQFGLVLSIASGAMLNYISPYINERLANINGVKKEEIVRITYIFLGVLSLFVVLVTFGAEIAFDHLLDPRYSQSRDYVFWVTLAYLFWGGFSVFSQYIFFFKRTRILSSLAILNIGLNLLLNYLLIPKYGPLGAAYATTISFGVVLIGAIIASWRVYPMPWFYMLKRNVD